MPCLCASPPLLFSPAPLPSPGRPPPPPATTVLLPPILFPPTPIKHFGILSRCPFPPLPQRSILIVLPDTTFAFFPPLDPGREGGGERKEEKEKRKLVVRAKGGQAVSRNEIRAGGEGGRRVFHAKAKKESETEQKEVWRKTTRRPTARSSRRVLMRKSRRVVDWSRNYHATSFLLSPRP